MKFTKRLIKLAILISVRAKPEKTKDTTEDEEEDKKNAVVEADAAN